MGWCECRIVELFPSPKGTDSLASRASYGMTSSYESDDNTRPFQSSVLCLPVFPENDLSCISST